jgi:pimeloyl-ACP methyl ester carboxylesterase
MMNVSFRLLLVLLFTKAVYAQSTSFTALNAIDGLTVTTLENPAFAEFYELILVQPLDHNDSTAGTFQQKILLGINYPNAPTVMETEGYAMNDQPSLLGFRDFNYVGIEHRFFGDSKPSVPNYKYLTIAQAAEDYHRIRLLLSSVLQGKWLITGRSKGGQSALSYTQKYPQDSDVTMVFVTPVKDGANDARFNAHIASRLQSPEGKKVAAFQRTAALHKMQLVKELEKIAEIKSFDFTSLGALTVLEYMILEYPVSYFQLCHTGPIPDSSASPESMFYHLATVVSPRYFSDSWRPQLEPAFYMFYHELGYYNYDLENVKGLLSGKEYSPRIFAPANTTFDPSYLSKLSKFLSEKNSSNIVFIYGEQDVYSSLAVRNEDNHFLKFSVNNKCHRVQLSDLEEKQRLLLYERLTMWLDWQVY